MQDTIKLRGVVEEDLCNYKEWSMFLITTTCNFKCCIEGGFDKSVCQNEPLIKDSQIKEYKIESIYNAYINNPITHAIVFGGLEPMMQIDELEYFIKYFREHDCNDTIVIYTGYYPNEIEKELHRLKQYSNIICKFGRYVPNNKEHYDKVLGISLVSDNQYGEKIS